MTSLLQGGMEQSASTFSCNESFHYFVSQNHLSLVRGMFMKPSRVQVLHGRIAILSPFKWPLRLKVILQALLHHVKGDLRRVVFKSNQSSKPSLPTGELNGHHGKAGNIRHCPGAKDVVSMPVGTLHSLHFSRSPSVAQMSMILGFSLVLIIS